MNNYLNKPHLCALYGCMTPVDGGAFACEACSRDITEEERGAISATWMRDGFDAIVERVRGRVRLARAQSPGVER